MYCELGGVVCGEIDTLGNEKEVVYCDLGWGVCGEIDTLGNEKEGVCIASWEGAYGGRSTRLETRKRVYVL